MQRVLPDSLCYHGGACGVSGLCSDTAVKQHRQLVHMFHCDWPRPGLDVWSGLEQTDTLGLPAKDVSLCFSVAWLSVYTQDCKSHDSD